MLDKTKSRDAASRRKSFRRAVAERRALLVPGAANALTARIIEDLGFEALYLTGAGFANTELGIPDIGLVNMTEITEAAMRIGDICSLPLIVDIDTGFGNALNVYRTVRTMERAGAAALQIEDQVFPKKCGHFDGKGIIPIKEMVAKIHAAVDTRTDPDLLIIARTDARAVEGLTQALDRAEAMLEAGADMLFVEAPLDREELQRIAQLPAPQLVNIVFGGRTPMLSRSELQEMGFSVVLYANAALQATIQAVGSVLSHLRDTGSLANMESSLAGFAERQRIVGKEHFDAIEKTYAVD
jgi:2-methylisocitrate lyase-like PEP mutase family enzyme